jgi:ParB-like chromosome segregation protein Spo0J
VIPSLVFYFLQATISWNGRPFAHRDWRTKSRSQETCRSPRDAARRSRSLQGQIASINDQFEAFKAVAKHHDNSLETQKTIWELEWNKGARKPTKRAPDVARNEADAALEEAMASISKTSPCPATQRSKHPQLGEKATQHVKPPARSSLEALRSFRAHAHKT